MKQNLLAVFLISAKVCAIIKFLENDINQQLVFSAKKGIRGRERLALKFSFSVHLELRKERSYLTTFRMFSTFV